MMGEVVEPMSMIGDKQVWQQQDEDDILNICDIDVDDFSGVLFSHLFKDNDDNNEGFSTPSSDSSSRLSSPSSCVTQGSVSPCTESSDSSLWIRQIEEMLFNEDDISNHKVEDFISTSVEDDFFADLDFPVLQEEEHRDDGALEKSQFQSNDQVRNFIDEDVDVDIDVDDDFMDVFNDVPIEESDEFEFGVVLNNEKPAPQIQIYSENFSPENDNSSTEKEERTNDYSDDKEDEVNEKKRAHDSEDIEDNEDDDPITKKHKRQMRNRDAAVRSRERKKLYVKDLELKSKYLEGECIRLQRLLQYCAAVNHALRFQLQEKAIAASRTKQESAVLLLESLLLVSLLWFLAMVAGLLSPLEMLLLQQLPARSVVEASVGSNNQNVVALERAKRKRRVGIATLRLSFVNDRGKLSRSKLRTTVVECYAAAAAAAA